MTPVRGIHHINFLFRDLERAVAHFERRLGLGPFEFADLDTRGVRTARVRVGETWLVLVSPTDADSVPARHIDKNGEGFFLLSFAVDDLGEALEALAATGTSVAEPRAGLANWQVADLDPAQTLGLSLQLASDEG